MVAILIDAEIAIASSISRTGITIERHKLVYLNHANSLLLYRVLRILGKVSILCKGNI